MENKKVTAGRDRLGEFAPQFAELNDDVLFGQVWSRESQLSPRERSMITVAALMGAGVTDFAMKSHLQKAKENGITKEEMVEMITQLAFYAGCTFATTIGRHHSGRCIIVKQTPTGVL